ncbi:Uncharacterised protein [uncultured archaeon]|nr:Uncharacterised protein [uncultured archaeon]
MHCFYKRVVLIVYLMKLKQIAILIVGVISALLGFLWFLQGVGVLRQCPILCFADCECITGGSLLWEVIGAAAFIIGIAIMWLNRVLGQQKVRK